MIGLLQVPFTVPMCFWVRMHAVWPSREKAGGSALRTMPYFKID